MKATLRFEPTNKPFFLFYYNQQLLEQTFDNDLASYLMRVITEAHNICVKNIINSNRAYIGIVNSPNFTEYESLFNNNSQLDLGIYLKFDNSFNPYILISSDVGVWRFNYDNKGGPSDKYFTVGDVINSTTVWSGKITAIDGVSLSVKKISGTLPVDNDAFTNGVTTAIVNGNATVVGNNSDDMQFIRKLIDYLQTHNMFVYFVENPDLQRMEIVFKF